MTYPLLIDPIYNWSHRKDKNYTVYSIGREKSVNELVKSLPADGQCDLSRMGNLLSVLKGHFAAIIDTTEWIFAFTDKIRGYPIYYMEKDGEFYVSNSARKIKDNKQLNDVDSLAMLEICMAGYVTGRETIFKDLCQMQAGEYLLWYKRGKKLIRKRYYLFYTEGTKKENEESLLEELEEITNTIFRRTIDDAAGRQIWVPLSGGLDSRLVVCKLKELGYDNLRTFSYGIPGNFDVKVAREVAARLQVPWQFIPADVKKSREFFQSEKRKKYWQFADGLHIPPNLHTFYALQELKRSRQLEQDHVIINGQSGDFIAGMHIPKLSANSFPDIDLCIDKIIHRHFSHFVNYINDSTKYSKIKRKIYDLLTENVSMKIDNYQEFAKIYELWEWQERQAKRVINGQRNYDFFQVSWALPLWEDEYFKFWDKIPLERKLQRKLFVKYVEQYDFFKLFNNFKTRPSRWPSQRLYIQFIGNGLTVLLGRRISSKYYKLLDCFSQYSYLYPHKSYLHYLSELKTCASPIAYFSKVWLQENFSSKSF